MIIKTERINSIEKESSSSWYSKLLIDIDEDENGILDQMDDSIITEYSKELDWEEDTIEDLIRNNVGKAKEAICSYFSKEDLKNLIVDYFGEP